MEAVEIKKKIEKLATDVSVAYGCSISEAIMHIEKACEVVRFKKPSSDFLNSYRNIDK